VARSPILSFLRRLAADHAEADRLGIPVEDVVERRLTRGELLRRGGAAGAALALGPSLVGFGRTNAKGRRIAIVGGGIAGLSAALTLHDHGVASTVYEADPRRVGGRMHTFFPGYWDNGQITEWCGELIDSDMAVVRGLSRRFKLHLNDLPRLQPAGTQDTYRFFGKYYANKQLLHDFRPVFHAVEHDLKAAGSDTTYKQHTPAGIALDRMTLYEWIETRVPGGHHASLGRLLDIAYNQEWAADTTDQSALNIVYELGPGQRRGQFSMYGESDERFHIAGGNERLPLAVADALPAGTIVHGWRMTAIRRQGDGTVRLTFQAGGETHIVDADRAILCLPFAVLRRLDYSGAGFDAHKRRCIEQIGAGQNTKLLLQFDERLWNRRGAWGKSTGTSYSDQGYMTTWDTTRGQAGPSGILVDYTGGHVARGFHAPEPYLTAAHPLVRGYARRFLRQVEPTFPGISRTWTGKATLSTPFSDPNLLLSYSYVKPGQTHTLVGYERVPQQNIHFAGEHTSVDFRGFMEGGAAEGVRAGREVLRTL
jgi:monoamine oxidase